MDSDSAKVGGQLARITAGPADVMPSLAVDGTKLVFSAAHPKARTKTAPSELPITLPDEGLNVEIRTKDLSTGKESRMPTAGAPEWHPEVSRDGSMIAYVSSKPGRIYSVSTAGGAPKKLLDGSNLFVWSWSSDKRDLLFTHTDGRLHRLDVTSGKEALFLDKPGFSVYQANFSPDDQWIAAVFCGENVAIPECRIFIVPLENGTPAAQTRWIGIDHLGKWDDKPRWSPDGNLLYFISDRDNYLCLWAQRLASGTRQPVSAAFPVYHFHNARLAMANVNTGLLEIGVAKDKIVLGLGEVTGNIWKLNRSK